MKTLFNKPLCHNSDPVTSLEAADKLVKSGRLTKQEKLVLRCVEYHKNNYLWREDFTAKEISNASCLDYHLIQRRLSGLRNKSKIERVITGKTKNGAVIYKKRNGQCVWRLKNG